MKHFERVSIGASNRGSYGREWVTTYPSVYLEMSLRTPKSRYFSQNIT